MRRRGVSVDAQRRLLEREDGVLHRVTEILRKCRRIALRWEARLPGTAGDTLRRSAVITLQSRDWDGLLPADYPMPRLVGQGRLPAHPDSVSDLGQATHTIRTDIGF